ncbi:MAG TPA: hypothetical protein VE988_30795 [Gemmataceae bacterium]|nr:hypothetical protein [Gemmataceae bacterium]
MDIASQHLVADLESLAKIEGRLRSFGRALWLETKAKSCAQPSGLRFCGIGYAPSVPAVTIGFAITCDASRNKAIVFSILVAWTATHWSIQSFVEEEDVTRDVIQDELWKSEEFIAAAFDDLVGSLDKSIEALKSSIRNDRVSGILAAIRERHLP